MQSKARWWESNLNLGFAGTVAASLVVVALVSVFGLIPVWQWLKSVGRWLVHPVSVPFVVVIAMVGALGVFVVGLLLKLKQPPPPAWLDYRQDNFLGIIWRWRYFSEGHELINSSITPYCPQCGTRLRGEKQHDRNGTLTTVFLCDECQFNQAIPGNGEDVFARVVRLVEREVHRRMALPVP
jgi:hypothetical protein